MERVPEFGKEVGSGGTPNTEGARPGGHRGGGGQAALPCVLPGHLRLAVALRRRTSPGALLPAGPEKPPRRPAPDAPHVHSPSSARPQLPAPGARGRFHARRARAPPARPGRRREGAVATEYQGLRQSLRGPRPTTPARALRPVSPGGLRVRQPGFGGEPRGSRGSVASGGLHGSRQVGGRGGALKAPPSLLLRVLRSQKERSRGPGGAGMGWRRGRHDPRPLQQEEAVTLD